VDEDGHAVELRGVSVVGLDEAARGTGPLSDALALDQQNLDALLDDWGFNLIRLPFLASTFISDSDETQDGTLSQLDDLVTWIADAGVYVLLSMGVVAGAMRPAASDFLCWKALASRYQDNPAVLYELFAASQPLARDWPDIAAHLIGTVRQEHTASLLVVGNGAASLNVDGLPFRFTTGDPIHNLIYGVRLTPELLSGADHTRLRALAQGYPLMASEWLEGAEGARAADLSASLLERLGAGWVAANWNAAPRIVNDAHAHNFAPTRFGLVVKRALASPSRLQLLAYQGPSPTSE